VASVNKYASSPDGHAFRKSSKGWQSFQFKTWYLALEWVVVMVMLVKMCLSWCVAFAQWLN